MIGLVLWAALAGAQDLTTTVSLAWDPSPDAAAGKVLSYRVYVGSTLARETGQLAATVPVRRGVDEALSVASFGNYDVDGDGLVEPGEAGEGPRSSTVFYTAPSIHLPSFLGCYADGAPRALPAGLMSGGATAASCISAARSRGYRFAGVQWRGECFAGNERRYDPRPVAECNLPCDARPGELCGGASRNSVYPTGLPPLAPTGVQIIK